MRGCVPWLSQDGPLVRDWLTVAKQRNLDNKCAFELYLGGTRSSRSSRSINNRQVFSWGRQTSDPQKTCVTTQKHLNWTDYTFGGTNEQWRVTQRGFWLNWAFRSFVCWGLYSIALNWKCKETHCQLNNRTPTWGHPRRYAETRPSPCVTALLLFLPTHRCATGTRHHRKHDKITIIFFAGCGKRFWMELIYWAMGMRQRILLQANAFVVVVAEFMNHPVTDGPG